MRAAIRRPDVYAPLPQGVEHPPLRFVHFVAWWLNAIFLLRDLGDLRAFALKTNWGNPTNPEEDIRR